MARDTLPPPRSGDGRGLDPTTLSLSTVEPCCLRRGASGAIGARHVRGAPGNNRCRAGNQAPFSEAWHSEARYSQARHSQARHSEAGMTGDQPRTDGADAADERPIGTSPGTVPALAPADRTAETAVARGTPPRPALADTANAETAPGVGDSSVAGGFPNAPPWLSAGMSVAQFEIIRELGRGGMGQVYLARDTRLGRLVALKFLALRASELVERFLVEARATARCTHENIVVIYEVSE